MNRPVDEYVAFVCIEQDVPGFRRDGHADNKESHRMHDNAVSEDVEVSCHHHDSGHQEHGVEPGRR